MCPQDTHYGVLVLALIELRLDLVPQRTMSSRLKGPIPSGRSPVGPGFGGSWGTCWGAGWGSGLAGSGRAA